MAAISRRRAEGLISAGSSSIGRIAGLLQDVPTTAFPIHRDPLAVWLAVSEVEGRISDDFLLLTYPAGVRSVGVGCGGGATKKCINGRQPSAAPSSASAGRHSSGSAYLVGSLGSASGLAHTPAQCAPQDGQSPPAVRYFAVAAHLARSMSTSPQCTHNVSRYSSLSKCSKV